MKKKKKSALVSLGWCWSSKKFPSAGSVIWEKTKKGKGDFDTTNSSWRTWMQLREASLRLTKTRCTGFSPVNISLCVFLQKWTLEPKSLLKHVQNYPGNIYNINSKTAGKTFLNQSLMHLCHLVNKAQLKCFCEREDRTLVSSEMLVGSEVCFGGSLS